MKFSNISVRAKLFRITAVLLAAATTQMLWSNLRSIERQAHQLGPIISVVIATRDLPVGLTVTASDVHTEPRHRTQMPAGVLMSRATAIGATVRVGLLKDSPLQTRNLQVAQPGSHSIVPRGYRALRVRDLAGLLPAPGTVVDIIANFLPADGVSTDARTLTDKSQVIASGAVVMFDQESAPQRSAQHRNANNSDQAIIVRVKERDVTAITFAQSFGTVSIVLAPLENACCESDNTP